MAENRNTINIKSDESGEIKVADEVLPWQAISQTRLSAGSV